MKKGDVVRVIAGFGDYYDHTEHGYVRVHGVGLIVSEHKNINHEVKVLINGSVYHIHECYLEVISKINHVPS
tara:strand:+ start:138 stop:353 length:216 start_codon:yes stop_codon:yes gene_type:complete